MTKRKRKAKRSTTQASIDWLKERGWQAEKVEQRIMKFVTRDLFNCIDLVAMRPGELAGIQVTTGDHFAERKAKILAEPMMRDWLKSGGTLYVHGWSWKGKTGAQTWDLRIEQVTLADYGNATQDSVDVSVPLDELSVKPTPALKV